MSVECPTPETQLITVSRACKRYGLQNTHVLALIKGKEIPHLRLGKRVILIPARELEKYLSARYVPATA